MDANEGGATIDRGTHGTEGAAPGPRAGALTAVAAVVGLAVLVAGALVGGMRLTAAPAEAEHASRLVADDPPEVLAGGQAPAPVPDAVAAVVDGPVVGVALVSEAPDEARQCGDILDGDPHLLDDAELLWGVATPDGLHLAYRHNRDPWGALQGGDDGTVVEAVPAPPREEPASDAVPGTEPGEPANEPRTGEPANEPRTDAPGSDVPPPDVPPPDVPRPVEPGREEAWFLQTCDLRWRDGAWLPGGGGSGLVIAPDEPLPPQLFGGSSCCEPDGTATAEAGVVPPVGTDWALHDRGGYWLAYPTATLDVVPLSWHFRQQAFGSALGEPMRAPLTEVRFVTTDGTIIEERFVGG